MVSLCMKTVGEYISKKGRLFFYLLMYVVTCVKVTAPEQKYKTASIRILEMCSHKQYHDENHWHKKQTAYTLTKNASWSVWLIQFCITNVVVLGNQLFLCGLCYFTMLQLLSKFVTKRFRVYRNATIHLK